MPIFQIPLAFGTIGSESKSLNDLLLKDVVAETKHQTQSRSGVHVFQTMNSMEDKYESFKDLKVVIDSLAKEALHQFGVYENQIQSYDYWGNYNPGNPTAYHMPHSHGINGPIFTGVYFPMGDNTKMDEVPEISANSHPPPGSLVLLDPIEYIKSAISSSKTERYPYFGLPICVTPQEGAFFIFPSYLPHMVVPTENDKMRCTIAFNIKVE